MTKSDQNRSGQTWQGALYSTLKNLCQYSPVTFTGSLCLLACLFAYLSCKLLCTWHYSLISTYLSSSSSNFPYKIIALLSFYNFQQLILIKQSCKFSIMIHNFVLLCFYFIYKILWFIKYFYIYVFKFFT